ncbi:L,D-transpeptidase [Spirulina subsalsa FACHB-351]|uniref:L,D-transpeptidase n=1 Tax=Spirulina subsalsa FACHB-351 TaxID=234711 RepID=A0ABT3L0H7_9CYAN|nr:L,D-transpeptidase [Spirulina subsalsa]MCW6035008.1 L,D-transpeptidase [Spirulina subsalsa FACHB-351]
MWTVFDFKTYQLAPVQTLASRLIGRCLTGAILCVLFGQGGMAAASTPSPMGVLSEMLPFDVPTLGESSRFLPHEIPGRLVLRLRDRRVYYYLGDELVVSYPVAIGRQGWETPKGQFEVQQKVVNPVWEHPFTRERVPPGPDNPLGSHWIGFWTDGENAIGFHGTPQEELIGQAVSHGCVRMRNSDIAALFEKVKVGTVVIVE